ncbi:hypothetical protein KKE60_00315, partial [Patescibacteria group bacterium]|nr:hypothetical protein [Patescibacteria group bacterium]
LSDYEQCIADGNTPTECSGTSDSDDENDTSTSQCFTQTPSIHIGDYGYCGWPVCIGLVDGKPVCSSGCTCPQSAPSCTGDEVPGTAGTSFASKFCVGSYVYDDPGDDNSDDSDDSETTASCLDISVFDIEWSPITNLSSLVAGDVVRFTVAGTTNSGSFDKARFTINGVLRTEVTTKRPSTNEFYDEYTIPEDITTFTINAEIHHTTLGWF